MTASLPSPPPADVLELLEHGELEVRGRLLDASNTTLLTRVSLDGADGWCVYKPAAGERPLWDFPDRTLANREVGSYLVSAALGFDVIPPTVLRDGPFGAGSVQWWVQAGGTDAAGDPEPGEPGAGLIDVVVPGALPDGWRVVLQGEAPDGSPVLLAHADDDALRRMAALDIVLNNADRKGGHVLRDLAGAVFGVDNGLTFNTDHKLRTVLWGWAGEPVPGELLEPLERLSAQLRGDGLSGRRQLLEQLGTLLGRPEIERTAQRAAGLVRAGRFPQPRAGRPAIPWPAF